MPTNEGKRDLASMLIAAVMIIIGAIAWADTMTMSDSDSYVFPRAIIILMVTFSLMLIVFNLIRPASANGDARDEGSFPRRLALVAVMLVGAGVMPYVGFFLSGLMVFAVLTVIAMYDPWTRFRIVAYPFIGLAVVTGFYVLFAKVLLVPLPAGVLFD